MVSDEKSKSLLSYIPMFIFGEHWKTMNQISTNGKCLILTEKIAPIKDVLAKLGFSISNDYFENHPLHSIKQIRKSLDIAKELGQENVMKKLPNEE